MIQLRVGLCGLGFMGRAHLDGYARIPGVEVAAVCHAGAKRFKKTASGNIPNLGGGEALLEKARRYTTLAEMLRFEKLDLVDICTPTFTHSRLACQALESGVHVLCEKPMALRVADCDRMIRAARSARRFLMVAHCLRWWPEYIYLHDLIRSGRCGRLKSLHMLRASAPISWAKWMEDEAKSGGPLLDLHIHDLDQALWSLGSPIAVTATLSEDRLAGAVLYRYPRCFVTAEYNANLAGGFQFNMSYRAQFERATLAFDFSAKPAFTLWANGRKTHPKVLAANAYEQEIRHMLDCIRKFRAPSRLTPQEARDAIALAHIERKAAESGKWLPIHDFRSNSKRPVRKKQ